MSEEHDIDRFFTDANLVDRPPDVRLSPSGRFRLEIRGYTTRPGCWTYSRGTVVRVADGRVVADVRRNYSAFHHSFVSRGDHEYLIAGRSYMGQTVVDLDDGKEWNDPKHPAGYEGHEFCWAACQLSPDGRTLLVDGCHWACPYEYRFYDFEDPSRGWTPLPVRDADGEAVWLEADDGRGPELHEDGRIECFESARLFVPRQRRDYEIPQSERKIIDPHQWEDPASWEVVVDRRVVLGRRPDHMLVIEDWCSPAHVEQQAPQR